MSDKDAALLSLFPIPVLTPVATSTSVPTYASLQVVQTELNSNATAIHSTGGDGRFGHLVLTMQPAKYATLTHNVPYAVPVHPGATPVHAPNATGPQIAENTRLHELELRIFRTYHAVDQALRQQLLAACPPTYVRALQDRDLGFGNVPTLALLTHLWTTYGRITPEALDANIARMHKPWHPPTPIEDLFDQLADATTFAIAGNAAIGNTNVIRVGYNLIAATGLFDLACRDWRAKPDAAKDMPSFRAHFRAANDDRTVTTGSAGYHTATGANAASTVAPTTALSMALNCSSTEHQLSQLTAAVTKLHLAITAPSPRPRSTQHPPPAATTNTYCWTHGATLNPFHTSATCKNKADGHQDTATAANPLNGSTRILRTRPATTHHTGS